MTTIAGALSRYPRAFTPLCAALLTVQISAPFLEQFNLASTVLTTLFLLTGLLALSSSPRLRLAAIVGLLVVIVVRWASTTCTVQSNSVKMTSALLIAVYAGLLAGHVLAAVLRESHVSFDTIAGAVAVYLLVAHAFALGYFALELGRAGSIDGVTMKSGDEGVEGWPLSGFLYFSFVTLTTLGYGDISPASPAARTLVMLEVTCGQFFFAVFVARLVASLRR